MAKSNALGSLLMYGAVGAGVYYFLIKPMQEGTSSLPALPGSGGGGVVTPTTPIPPTPAPTQTAAPNIPAAPQSGGITPLPTAPTPTPTPYNPHDSPSVPLATLSIAEKVSAAAGPGALLSADSWNWHWSNQSGVPQTADLFPADNRGALMSIKEYLSRRTAAGLSGLGGPRALYGGGHGMHGWRNPGGNYVQTNNRPTPLGIRR